MGTRKESRWPASLGAGQHSPCIPHGSYGCSHWPPCIPGARLGKSGTRAQRTGPEPCVLDVSKNGNVEGSLRRRFFGADMAADFSVGGHGRPTHGTRDLDRPERNGRGWRSTEEPESGIDRHRRGLGRSPCRGLARKRDRGGRQAPPQLWEARPPPKARPGSKTGEGIIGPRPLKPFDRPRRVPAGALPGSEQT